MNDLDKLNYLIRHYNSEDLLQELFRRVRKSDEAQEWLQDAYTGYAEQQQEEDDERLTAYERNPGWRNW